MVTKWGLSDKLGPLMYDEDDGEVFLGMSAGVKPKPHSQQTAQAIDEEVRRIIDDCYGEANRLLTEERGQAAFDGQCADRVRNPAAGADRRHHGGAKPRQPKPPKAGKGSKSGTPEPAIGGPAEEH